MRVDVHLIGKTPLLMHNVQLADPDNEWFKLIQEITKKGQNMTAVDRREKARLQWYGGLYVGSNGEGPVVPTANIRRCFQEAAKLTKNGKDITRAVIPLAIETPVLYEGPRDLAKLWQLPQHEHTTMVGIPGRRTKLPSTRPVFPRWEVRCDFELIVETLDYTAFVAIVGRAGVVEGLGDNRVNGYGRFEARVAQV